MATNYAQKLERERQSPKGNLTRDQFKTWLNDKIVTDTGWLKRAVTSNIKSPKDVAKGVGKTLLNKLKVDDDFRNKNQKPPKKMEEWFRRVRQGK